MRNLLQRYGIPPGPHEAHQKRHPHHGGGDEHQDRQDSLPEQRQ